jgi:hypothetical protein
MRNVYWRTAPTLQRCKPQRRRHEAVASDLWAEIGVRQSKSEQGRGDREDDYGPDIGSFPGESLGSFPVAPPIVFKAVP